MSVKQYLCPSTLQEALKILKEADGAARVAAGATDLFLDLEKEKKSAEILVDVRKIPELRAAERRGEAFYIGGAVTHTEIEQNAQIRELFPALAKGASVVGGPQIRNVGTIAGNVVNAQPAADTAVPLIAYGAEAVIAGYDGQERTVPVEDLYEGPGRSRLDASREILVGFLLPVGKYSCSGFAREGKRNALTLPMLNLAAALCVRDGVIAGASLVAGPVSVKPLHLTDAENLLTGKAPSAALFEEAGALAEAQAAPRDSLLRGGSRFRKELLRVMVRELLSELAL
ncbi:MAG: FAD binding domain-containing protein [Lachnospiraceae bacterium]|nr:FAD binding domain-containing protein [Lachnospiraceae bacterium]